MEPQQVIASFYEAFGARDWRRMQACYHPLVEFSDPVFPNLTGLQVRAMWHMLVSRGNDLEIKVRDIQADKGKGQCRWEAKYRFGKMQRPVHNQIVASFRFSEGLIIFHQDRFDLWKWCSMALGWPGRLLGWTAFMQERVRRKAAYRLFEFIGQHPEYK